MEAVVIRGISIDRNQARVTITGIPDQIGYTAQILALWQKRKSTWI